ncbi:hypothetical protein [Thermus phage P23-45]|uniref:Uncharacterized protein n=1 Tax=Thermus virus P23-45 TaxID=2914006 RepID=A7XXA4_BP234|nr:tail fiber protein [Thermus phage P23-45]ABU96906.1 hypothetical protein P23p73 [Thermus phage P23-45]UYB98402.1 hypothetical protein [Thermus phage P23-45]
MAKLVVVRLGARRDTTPARELAEALVAAGATCVKVWGRLRSRLHVQREVVYDLRDGEFRDGWVEYPLGPAVVLQVEGLSRKKLKRVLMEVGTGWPKVHAEPAPYWRRA